MLSGINMDHSVFVVFGIILAITNDCGGTIARKEATDAPGSGSPELVQLRSEKCSNSAKRVYRCVRIEECGVRGRRGSGTFCEWEGKPTHVCCPQSRVIDRDDLHERRKRFYDDSYEDHSSRENYHWYGSREEPRDEEIARRKPQFRPTRPYTLDYRRYRDHNHGWHGDDSDEDYRHHEECGIFEDDPRNTGFGVASMTGGVARTTAATSPWMAAIGQIRNGGKADWFCGGVLISLDLVLTAAHCVTMRTANVVRVGDLDLASSTDVAEPQDSRVKFTIIHPEHKAPTFYHDIAALRLETPMRYSKYVRPVCLPSGRSDESDNALVTLTGWGSVDYGSRNGHVLQAAQLQVISNCECNSRYATLTAGINAQSLPYGIIDSQMCAGDRNGGRDACHGDSGGPIVKKDGRRNVVVGLVSSGLGCGSKFYPGIYTRVSYYVDWIRNLL